MTVLESIQLGTDFLTRKGVESPRLQTELLIAHVLALPRMQLYLQFERPLSDPETARLRELLKRRGQREPLQHIVGSVSFCGIELAVNRSVLVPRPETEILAERGWCYLQELAADPGREITAVDIGTGSGCLAIALAAHSDRAKIAATDISLAALEVARANAARVPQAANRIQFLHGSGFEPLPSDARFDLIISNPPYISRSEIETLDPEVRNFDPRAALDGGEDGLDFYGLLAEQGARWLKTTGRMLLEFGDGQETEIRKLLEAQNWVVEGVFEDYTRRPRIIMAKCR